MLGTGVGGKALWYLELVVLAIHGKGLKIAEQSRDQ